MSELSVIICTYNPDRTIFGRVLSAITQATIPDRENFECVIVDNNSINRIDQEEWVVSKIASIPNARIVIETQQGLTPSRIRGMKESRFSHLLFIDDDNEIASDFFVQLEEVIKSNPTLGACNPGKINVEFIGPVDEWFLSKAKVHFQQSDIQQTMISAESTTFRHWPFGTGLMVKREVAEYYQKQFSAGRFTLSDRKGEVLTSGGDGQLVASALELGYAVGRIRGLSVNHLIAARKATLDYLIRLDYGIYFSDELFMKECYPLRFKPLSGGAEMKVLFKLFSRDLLWYLLRSDLKKYRIAVATRVGMINGKRTAAGKPLSAILAGLQRWITRR